MKGALEGGSFCGYVLNHAERFAIQNSIQRLKLQQPKANFSFWGKIQGSQKDYLIVKAIILTHKIDTLYYMSNDEGGTFGLLPQIDSFVQEKSANITTPFLGDPAFTYQSNPASDQQDQDQDAPADTDDGERKVVETEKRTLTELQRLTYAVQHIDQSTSIIPLNSYILTPTGDIALNNSFPGLNPTELKKLASYLHFRNEKSSETNVAIRRAGVSNFAHFLDSIQQDQPSGMWSLIEDESGKLVKIRSELWMGYECQIEAFSAHFQSAYFGSGLHNSDILFMV